jgi:hypothetical protein
VLWLTRAEALALIDGKAAGLTGPPAFAIAHSLIRGWAKGG